MEFDTGKTTNVSNLTHYLTATDCEIITMRILDITDILGMHPPKISN